MKNPVLLLGAAAVAYILYDKSRNEGTARDMAKPLLGVPQPLRAGRKYLFLVRTELPDEQVRSVLAPKGVEALEMAPATVAPFWAKPGESYSARVAAFRATPQGNGVITLGDPFYGVGRLEKVVRLDGQPFDAE